VGRLFWKFFFFIWLAQLTTVAGVSAIFWLKNHELNSRVTNIDESPSASTLVESAASTLHYAGTEALRNLLGTRMHAIVYAVDETNKDILGRPVTPLMLEQADQMLAREPNLHAVEKVKAINGHIYMLFSTVPRHEIDHPSSADGRSLPGVVAAPSVSIRPHGHQHHFPIEPIIAGLFASLGFAALLAWYFSKPIHSLRSAFESVSEGDMDVHLATVMGKRRDELADLGHDFDRMVRQLRALMDGQRRLLHDVSHELRSPLARLQAAIGLARQQPDKLENSLDRIELEGTRMDKLVGELLTLSRLEAGVISSMDDEILIEELVDNIVKDARFEAEARQILVNRTGNYAATIKGNIEMLHWAIENVVRNAVKHTSDGTQINVDGHLDNRKSCFVLSVLDEGPGVPEAELETIFEPFFRGRSTKGTDGHGLGLAIARRIVEAYGGTIHASNRTNKGLCIEIMLPIHGTHPPQ
jgi:two-component system OmpR family sensor kinase